MLSTLVILSFLTCIQGGLIPENIYKYSMDRDALIEAESQYANKPPLNQDEQIVDIYLSYLKAEEFSRTRAGVPTSRPIEEELDNIKSSPLYRALRTMPKGGNMHTHENFLLSRETLLDIVFNSSDFQYLYVMDHNSSRTPWKLEFFLNPPENEPWINVKNSSFYTKEKILEKQTLMSLLTDEAKRYPSDAIKRWALVNTLWGRGSTQLLSNIAIKHKYIKAMLEAALEEGVQYIETRKMLGQLYELNADPDYNKTHGKKYLGESDGHMEQKYVKNITEEFIKENPSFIGLKRIGNLIRKNTKETVQQQIESFVSLHERDPHFMIGIDISAEENTGKSDLYFIDNLLSLYDDSSHENKLDLYLHVSETNFPDDQRFSLQPLDPTSALQNTYETVALRAKRVGHGLGFIKHPYLMNVLKQRNVAVEVCPVSNQILGFVPDLRNHPAQNYHRHGVPIVLGSDDAGIAGHNHFTVDWYMAFFGWGLDLADLKQIRDNSIEYSGMNQREKVAAYSKIEEKWENYISDKKTDACQAQFNSEPTFAKLLPHSGSLTGQTNISLFGSHFEAGICRSVKCRFGDRSVDAKLVSVHLIRCTSPPQDGASDVTTVPVSVALDGNNFIYTSFNFTYKYDYHPSTSKCDSVFRTTELLMLVVSLVFQFVN